MALDDFPDPPELPEDGDEPVSPTASGVRSDVSHETYHRRQLGVASKSALDKIARSPAHYKAWINGHDTPQTPAMAFGSAFDMALLEPDRFARRYVVEPSYDEYRDKAGRLSTNAGKAARETWRAEHRRQVWLDPAHLKLIESMVRAVREHDLASKLVTGGISQLTVKWRDEATGLECKGRPDYYIERLGLIVDAKTSDDASPDGFPRSCAKYGYHRQAAFYEDGLRAAGKPVDHFLFLAIEKEPPYAIGIYALDEDAMSKGRASIARDMRTLAECLRTDRWPAYGNGIQTLSLPKWAA